MIEEKYLELMNTEIDGVNTDEQSKELASFLETHDEAREHFDGLRAAMKAIASVRVASAPPGLFSRVMSQVSNSVAHAPAGDTPARDTPARDTPARDAPHKSQGGGLGDWLRAMFARPQLRLATSFAAGLAIGVTVYAIVTDDGSFRQPFDLSEFAGTMARFEDTATPERLAALAKSFDQIADVDVSVAGVSGYFHLHHSGKTVIADVALSSDHEIQWSLEYEADEVTLDGFRQLGEAAEFSSTASQTRVTLDGENRYVLLFRTHDGTLSAMTLRIYSNDKVVFENVVSAD